MLTPTPSVSVPLITTDQALTGQAFDQATVAWQHAAVMHGETAGKQRPELLAERGIEPQTRRVVPPRACHDPDPRP